MTNLKSTELFGPGGKAREHFKNLAGGAEWVDKVCDSLIADLEPLEILIDLMDQTNGFSSWNSNDRVQFSVAIEGNNSFAVSFGDNFVAALTEANRKYQFRMNNGDA